MRFDRSGHYTPYPGASGHREGGGLRPERGGNHDARSYQAIIPYTAHPSRSGALSSRVVARNEQLALYLDESAHAGAFIDAGSVIDHRSRDV